MSQLAPEPRPHTPQPEVAVRGPLRRVHIEPRTIITAVLFIAVIGSAIWYLARPESLVVRWEEGRGGIELSVRVRSFW
jgi:hypothetical protein